MGSVGDDGKSPVAESLVQQQQPSSVSTESPKCTDCTVSPKVQEEISKTCPAFQPTILRNHYPKDNKSAGTYVLVNAANTTDDCARQCCLNSTDCNFAFMVQSQCFLLTCYNEASCFPTKVSGNMPQLQQYNVSMVSVRVPTNIASTNIISNITCEVGVGNRCKPNQECVAVQQKSRNGVCQCTAGYVINVAAGDGSCEPIATTEPATDATVAATPTVATPKTIKTLAVSVVSKNVSLPINEVSLFAYAVPEAPTDQSYSYKWSLISHPTEDTAAMEGQTTQQLHLMGLKQGTYIFEVSVKSAEANGSANATIDVFAG
ncbi:hypothetical protein Ocin01_05591 [Orchesella cincta]|uniref:MANSC domain-containing protein n=1 Tax=Orchesella cincta TaxID=48709 RepID=A0A1D2N744_ORCCI|nr:hypothetical protein Ocin01_05591 [Orchesella cincta]